MKKLVMSLVLVAGLTAQAGILDFFDFTHFMEAALNIADGINANLEKVRLAEREKLNIQEQWDLTCEVSQAMNKNLEALNVLFGKYQVNQKTCVPVTSLIALQADIVKNCQNYYSKPVPANAEHLINKFSATLLQTKMLLNKCYPALKDVKIPGLPI